MSEAPKKRLFVVTATIEYEYAVMAVSKEDAEADVRMAEEALRDMADNEPCLHAREASKTKYAPPMDWDKDCLIYGADKDTTWAQAAEAESTADAEAKRVAEFNARQVPLLE